MAIDRKKQCADDLRDRILAYELPPGLALDETAISRQYGLSRTPLREIFQGLHAEGYIRLSANRGARAAPLDVDVVRALYQTAPFIYTAVSRLACQHRTPEQLDALKECQHGLQAAVAAENARAAALENHRFHVLIGEMTHNTYLIPTLNRLLVDHTRMGRDIYDPTGNKGSKQLRKALKQHDNLIEAIETQSIDRAIKLTLSHWDLSREMFDKLFDPEELVAELHLLDG